MNAECRVKIRRLAANADARKRMIGALWRSQMLVVQTAEYKIALLQRYPVGLIDDAEIEALLKSWPQHRTNLHPQAYSAPAT
ncbi:hypothetical protein [Pseudomonas sp.]|uniref:hypothetical protein n=1 Tax=Pseudomonas sp. TaxID=306 RepID=UPI0024886F82|nr:hypothetical protein [Pseudomonas sp.]MDI1330604.1 hypothetical protein [Pseudomonas sp.]